MDSSVQACWTGTLLLKDETATIGLAHSLRHGFGPGDVLLLSGEIGAGKTFFARALIKALLADQGLEEDIPSPTFTLVQTYQAGIWKSGIVTFIV